MLSTTQKGSNMQRTLTPADIRNLYRAQFRQVLGGLEPKAGGDRYSGQQRAYAKGIASRRTLEIVDQTHEAPDQIDRACAR
jgi:hypothetical protein